jgi:hypothetical protein
VPKTWQQSCQPSICDYPIIATLMCEWERFAATTGKKVWSPGPYTLTPANIWLVYLPVPCFYLRFVPQKCSWQTSEHMTFWPALIWGWVKLPTKLRYFEEPSCINQPWLVGYHPGFPVGFWPTLPQAVMAALQTAVSIFAPQPHACPVAGHGLWDPGLDLDVLHID